MIKLIVANLIADFIVIVLISIVMWYGVPIGNFIDWVKEKFNL